MTSRPLSRIARYGHHNELARGQPSPLRQSIYNIYSFAYLPQADSKRARAYWLKANSMRYKIIKYYICDNYRSHEISYYYKINIYTIKNLHSAKKRPATERFIL